ncbi:MAG: hypothetical protein WC205_07180 [Opitutaceae bacterium]|jgi:hypothetical protein
MKKSIVITLAALCLGVSAGFAQTPSLLIGKDRLNGGFESETLKPWFGQSDAPGPKIETTAGLVKEGKQSARIQLAGSSDRRVTARLFQTVNKVNPASGNHFVLKFDVTAVKDSPLPAIVAEVVLFENGAVLKTLPLRGEKYEGADWRTVELPTADEIPAAWTGGQVQVRILFFVDRGTDGITYELLLDNVELVQSRL